jgi:hypothetical protein
VVFYSVVQVWNAAAEDLAQEAVYQFPFGALQLFNVHHEYTVFTKAKVLPGTCLEMAGQHIPFLTFVPQRYGIHAVDEY